MRPVVLSQYLVSAMLSTTRTPLASQRERSAVRLTSLALIAALALAACSDATSPPAAPKVTGTASSRQSSPSSSFAHTTGAPGTRAAPGVIVAAGGGAEGNSGNTSAWSYRLYSELVANGDVTGDGTVRVAILSVAKETSWLPNYFVWIGQTLGVPVVATNIQVASRGDANNAATVGVVANADVVFLKGGDQGVYYDQWNGTLLETNIRVVTGRGGAVGGTSAGAMSLSQFCFCGGKDLVSADVMRNARTPFLDDASQPGTSGIHSDFLGFVTGVVFDSHFTTRGRLGRLIGILARATEDAALDTLLGVGLDERTGVVVRGGIAEVRGVGEVAFVRQGGATLRLRDAGRPLVYTGLNLDRLTDGWRFDLAHRSVVTSSPPSGALLIPPAPTRTANSGALSASGSTEGDRSKFAWIAAYAPSNYALAASGTVPQVHDAVAFMQSGNTTSRGPKQETLFRALYDKPWAAGVLAFAGGTISRTPARADALEIGGTSAAIIVDPAAATWKGLSPSRSNVASAGGTLQAAAFVGATLHVLGESIARGMRYDSRMHAVVP